MSLRVLQTGADFELHGGNANLLYTGTFLFVLLFALEYATNVLADVFLADDKELKNPLIRKKICRNLNEFLAMMFMVWLGYESFVENGRFSPFVHGVGVDDLFIFSGKAQRMVLFHASYEVKNFIKSYLDSDGVVYLAHHAVTFFLAFCALHPFLHYYAAFYLGISEFSTGFLCLFLCFDDKNGLKARFPATATMLGILFAINFVIFRIVLWFFFSYHFWIDLIALYTSGRIHSYPAFFSYAIGNTGLTILQLIWLGEIVSNVLNMGKSADSGAGTKDELASSNVKKGHKSNRNKK